MLLTGSRQEATVTPTISAWGKQEKKKREDPRTKAEHPSTNLGFRVDIIQRDFGNKNKHLII